MKIEVGEYYLSANGNIVKIMKQRLLTSLLISNIDVLHKSDGTVNNGFDREYDLIAHIPKQLLNYIVFVTELYHTNNDMKQMVDNNYGFNSNFIYSKMDKNNKKGTIIKPIKVDKEKNTFAKLRRINKALINKFEATNEMLKLATEQIDRLNKAIHIKDITIASLEIKEKELSDKIYRLYNNLSETNNMNTSNYLAWLSEHEENSKLIKINNKLSIGLTVMSLVIVGLVVTLIGVIG